MIEIIHSPRLEHLAAELMRELQRLRRRDARRIFAPLEIVVPHIGMARWLERQIAEHFGICANIRFIFPGEWVQRLNAQFLPELSTNTPESADPYQVGAMSWVLYQALESFADAEPATTPAQRYALAWRYARLFADYQIYRRDWLLEFSSMRIPLNPSRRDERTRQALLWQALQAALGKQDRSQRFSALQSAIESRDGLTQDRSTAQQSTIFFGMAQLPPDLLALLRTLAQRQTVQLYFPNPCVEYWADVVRERFLERRALSDDLLDPERAASAFDHFEVGHPLLAALGAQGQGFFAELANASDQFFEAQGAECVPPQPSLLQAVQMGIQQLQPDYCPKTLQADASLQILQCASRLDELYLVKAKIIEALNADPTLRLDQIAVLAPNLDQYAPLVASVFAADSHLRASGIRFALLDTIAAAEGPGAGVLALLSTLLQLEQMRFSAAELMQLLRLDVVALQFELDPFDLDRIEDLLAQARFAFALDAKHREQLMALGGVLHEPPQRSLQDALSLHTWLSALDRLVLGYLHGSDQSERLAAIQAPIWPVPDVGAGAVRLLGALAQLLRQLRLAMREIRRKRTLPEWCAWLDRQVLMLAGRACADTENYAPFKALLEQLNAQALSAGFLERVDFAAVREALRVLLNQSRLQANAPLGAVCVASLIPMRALPFRWIFVLGLNEGEFPQPAPPDSLNLMQLPGARRVGDRNRSNEDRYLFLEALMASRDGFILSFQAQAADGSVRAPAGVVSELVRQLHLQFGARFPTQPWLQDQRNLTVLVPPSNLSQSGTDVNKQNHYAHSTDGSEVTPQALLKFWKNPLKQCLQQRFGLLSARPSTEADYLEPLSLDADKIERIEWRLLRQATQTGTFPDAAPSWLAHSGLLPSGALGAQAWENVRARSRPIWQRFASEFAPLCAAQLDPVWVDLRFDSATVIRGWVSETFARSRCLVHLAPSVAHGGIWLELLIRAAILQANDPAPWRLIILNEFQTLEHCLFDQNSARAYLASLLALRTQTLSVPSGAGERGAEIAHSLPWFWPRLSFRAAREGSWPKSYQYPGSRENFELTQSGFYQIYPSEAAFTADAPALKQFLDLAGRVFAPIIPNAESPGATDVRFDQLGFDGESDASWESGFGGASDH